MKRLPGFTLEQKISRCRRRRTDQRAAGALTGVGLPALGNIPAFTVIPKNRSQKRITMIPLFSPLCGIAVREAVEKCLGAAVEIKWPMMC
jgi:hypothetical protein